MGWNLRNGGWRKRCKDRNLRQILRKLAARLLDPGRDAVMLPSRHTTGSCRKERFWVALPLACNSQIRSQSFLDK